MRVHLEVVVGEKLTVFWSADIPVPGQAFFVLPAGLHGPSHFE